MSANLLIATRNRAKFDEFALLLKPYELKFVSLEDLKITATAEETGETFNENAELKARFYGNLANIPTLADDGGLEIEYLNGWPGVSSRRIFGPDKPEASDEEMIAETMRRLDSVPTEKRTCRFTVSLALFLPPEALHLGHGFVAGVIPNEPSPVRVPGFPFRSIFFLPQFGKAIAELPPQAQADFMNHRKKAIIELEPYLRELERN